MTGAYKFAQGTVKYPPRVYFLIVFISKYGGLPMMTSKPPRSAMIG